MFFKKYKLKNYVDLPYKIEVFTAKVYFPFYVWYNSNENVSQKSGGMIFFDKQYRTERKVVSARKDLKYQDAVEKLNAAANKNRKTAVSRGNFWCQLSDLNQRPSDYKSDALPAELNWQGETIIYFLFYKIKHIFLKN